MINIINKMINLLLQMVNTRQSEISIENCCLKISSRCLSLSNNLLTLCLTMHNNINKAILSIVNKHINNSFANDKSQQTILATYQQHVNIISRDNIFVKHINNINHFANMLYTISARIYLCIHLANNLFTL